MNSYSKFKVEKQGRNCFKSNKKKLQQRPVLSCEMHFFFIDVAYNVYVFKLTTIRSQQYSLEPSPDVIEVNLNN